MLGRGHAPVTSAGVIGGAAGVLFGAVAGALAVPALMWSSSSTALPSDLDARALMATAVGAEVPSQALARDGRKFGYIGRESTSPVLLSLIGDGSYDAGNVRTEVATPRGWTVGAAAERLKGVGFNVASTSPADMHLVAENRDTGNVLTLYSPNVDGSTVVATITRSNPAGIGVASVAGALTGAAFGGLLGPWLWRRLAAARTRMQRVSRTAAAAGFLALAPGVVLTMALLTIGLWRALTDPRPFVPWAVFMLPVAKSLALVGAALLLTALLAGAWEHRPRLNRSQLAAGAPGRAQP